MSLTHALKWSFLSELAAKAIQPIVFVILASLLTPEDFGVMTAALMIVSFSNIFWDAGMGQALVQRQVNVDEAANVAFWINSAFGMGVAALLFVIAKPIALTFFQDDRVTMVLQVMTIHIVLGGLSAVHTSLLQKQFDFRKLFWVRLITVSLPMVASIPMAIFGMGYWALVVGALVGQLAQVVMLWLLSPWRPRWVFQLTVAREMLHFGSWVGVSGLLVWFYTWADSLIVGMYLGSHELGLYRLGSVIVTSIMGLMVGPLMPVAYSYFSASRNTVDKFRRQINFGEKLIAICIFPVVVALIISSNLLIKIFFDQSWEGVGTVIYLVAISQGLAFTVSLRQQVYRSIGLPEVETKIMSISMLIRLPFYLIFVQYGLVVFLIGRILATNFGVLNHLVFSKKVLDYPFYDYLKTISAPAFGAACALLLGAFVENIWAPGGEVLSTLVALFFAMAIYIVVVASIEKKFLFSILAKRV